jgi:biofilm PGA synthesis N-glycosyltransferase PgaC
MSERVLLLSCVRDEEALVERVARSVAAQTRPPDAWVVVDDGSRDGTAAILADLARELPWLEVRTAGEGHDRGSTVSGLADGAPARVFNAVLATVPLDRFDYVGVLDGDVEVPPAYLDHLLDVLRSDPTVGIAGADVVEPAGRRWRRLKAPPHHVHGAARLYRRRCLEVLLPLPELAGWDTVDQAYARMNGFRTCRLSTVVARHHRPCGARDGALGGHALYGAAAYAGGQPLRWVAMRAAKVSLARPRVVSGLAFLAGYCAAAVRRAPRVEDRRYRRFVRSELRARLGREPPRTPA